MQKIYNFVKIFNDAINWWPKHSATRIRKTIISLGLYFYKPDGCRLNNNG